MCSSDLNVRNGGAFADLPDDLVVEVTSHVDRTGARPLGGAPLRPEQHALVTALDRFQRLTIQAALSGNPDLAMDALMANPLVPSEDVAEPLLGAILSANRELLPRFFPGAAR